MKYSVAIAVAASMTVLAACKEAPHDPTPPVIDEPDSPPRVKEDSCNKGDAAPANKNVRCQ